MAPGEAPRIFYLTWRPTKHGSKLGSWMEAFRKRLEVVFDQSKVYHSEAETENRADVRDVKTDCTDVISFATLDYFASLKDDPDHELSTLVDRDPHGREIRLWAVRMDPMPIESFWRRYRDGRPNPWGAIERWHLLPEDPQGFLEVTQANIEDSFKPVQACCIEPMQSHGANCPRCSMRLAAETAPIAVATPANVPAGGLLVRLRHFFHR